MEHIKSKISQKQPGSVRAQIQDSVRGSAIRGSVQNQFSICVWFGTMVWWTFKKVYIREGVGKSC